MFSEWRLEPIAVTIKVVQSIDEESILDRGQLRDVTLDDEALMREIFSALIDDTSRQMRLLGDAIREQNPQRCMRLAHYSKGACANVGARRAAALLKQIEVQASAGGFAECAEALDKLAREVELLRAEVLSPPAAKL